MSNQKHESFASAKAYGQVLLIPYLATVGFLVKHYLDYRSVAKPIDSAWYNHYWAFDTGMTAHLGIIALLTFGLGASIILLRGLDCLLAEDERKR